MLPQLLDIKLCFAYSCLCRAQIVLPKDSKRDTQISWISYEYLKAIRYLLTVA